MCTWLDEFFVVGRSAERTGWSALYCKGLEGLQAELVEEVGTGQKNSASVLSMAGGICNCRRTWAAQCSQADGAVPGTSLDNLLALETNNKIS